VRYLDALRAVRREFVFQDAVVFAPGHGSDVSHCEAFHAARRIINLEIDPMYVEMMRAQYSGDSHVTSYLGDARSFVPDEQANVIVFHG
jgi:predicted RNA methylase